MLIVGIGKSRMTKQKIISRTKYWQEKLGLHNWRIRLYFSDFKEKVKHDKFSALARTDLNPTYLIADITFKEDDLALVDDTVIVHELLHIVMGDLVSYFLTNSDKVDIEDKWALYFEEKTVTTIERIVTRLHNVC